MKHRDRILFALPISVFGLVLFVVVMLLQQYFSFKASYLEDAKDDLRLRTMLIAETLEKDLYAGNLAAVTANCARFQPHPTRVSVIDLQGHVVADSNADVSKLGNHLMRPEIVDAAADNFVLRYSMTTASHVLHYVVRKGDYFVRVSMPVSAIEHTFTQAKISISLALALGLFLLFGSLLYVIFRVRPHFIALQKAATDIAYGKLDTPIHIPKSGLFRELSRAIATMARQLRHRIRDLQRAESFRSDFVANVSHEIKTPLTAILSTVELLSEGSVTEEQQSKCLKILNRQSRRLNNLVQDILSLAAIERRQGGTSDTAFVPFRLDSLLCDAVSLCTDTAEKANVTIRMPDTLPEVYTFGDPNLVEQCILNLIQNAIKHSGTSSVELHLRADAEQVALEVKDFGAGIAEEHLPRLFERFYRVHKERSRATGGTGLGLAIVKHIALLHRGNITVTSVLSQGTSFTLTLPTIAQP